MIRIARLAALSAAIALALGEGTALAQKRGGDVVVALYANANTIDPNFTASHISRSMLLGVYETLVTVDETTKVIPMLAESWQISADGSPIASLCVRASSSTTARP